MTSRSIMVLSSGAKAPLSLVEHLRSIGLGRVIESQSVPSVVPDVALVVVYVNSVGNESLFDGAATLRVRTGARLIVVAEQSCEALAIAALRSGASDYFCEPYDREAFSSAVATCVGKDATPSKALVGSGVLLGDSPAMQSIREYIAQVAATDCNVLITGETGTGKELAAQLIHANSARCKSSLVCVNCAAIPDALLESELFGHERGAFTGADTAQQGKLAIAHGGTVFFDEIGDMSYYAQAKILRAIETREIQRLGAKTPSFSDIRVLAATNRDLETMTTSDAFRKDLYFRLNVGRIHLPPLREHKGDLIALLGRLIETLNQRMGRSITGVSEEALECLLRYDWPGNVRELKNVIEGVFIARISGSIQAQDLPPHLPMRRPQPARSNAHSSPEELTQLISALSTCRWNKSKAAEKLNWSRMTLYRKIAKYKLLVPNEGTQSEVLTHAQESDKSA